MYERANRPYQSLLTLVIMRMVPDSEMNQSTNDVTQWQHVGILYSMRYFNVCSTTCIAQNQNNSSLAGWSLLIFIAALCSISCFDSYVCSCTYYVAMLNKGTLLRLESPAQKSRLDNVPTLTC